MGDLLIERDRAHGCILLPVSAKRRGPQQLHGAPPIQIQSMAEFAYGVRRNPSSTQIGFRSCLLLSCLAFRCVLAISR